MLSVPHTDHPAINERKDYSLEDIVQVCIYLPADFFFPVRAVGDNGNLKVFFRDITRFKTHACVTALDKERIHPLETVDIHTVTVVNILPGADVGGEVSFSKAGGQDFVIK